MEIMISGISTILERGDKTHITLGPTDTGPRLAPPRLSPFHIVQRIAYFQEIRRNSLIGCVCVSFCVSLLIRFGIDYEPVANLSRIIRGGTGKYGYLRCGHALFKCRYILVLVRVGPKGRRLWYGRVRDRTLPVHSRTHLR
jgi:hypothetical protein